MSLFRLKSESQQVVKVAIVKMGKSRCRLNIDESSRGFELLVNPGHSNVRLAIKFDKPQDTIF